MQSERASDIVRQYQMEVDAENKKDIQEDFGNTYRQYEKESEVRFEDLEQELQSDR